jgi:hypothetical protein
MKRFSLNLREQKYIIRKVKQFDMGNPVMKKMAILWGLIAVLAGCNKPARTPAHYLPPSQYDMAIENLSITTNQLDAISKEKDLFIQALESFEQQKNKYGYLMDINGIQKQMQQFADWHKDITSRETNLEVRHSLNVFAAHNQVIKRKMTDPNPIEQAIP